MKFTLLVAFVASSSAITYIPEVGIDQYAADGITGLHQSQTTPHCTYTKQTDGDGTCLKDAVQSNDPCTDAGSATTFAIDIATHACTWL